MTEQQIREACKNLEESLLAALRRNEDIGFQTKHFSRPVYDEPGVYGRSPVDAVYTGSRFIVEIGEPARDSMRKARMGIRD